jgi:peptide-methionine (R)-S-oxide reductase
MNKIIVLLMLLSFISCSSNSQQVETETHKKEIVKPKSELEPENRSTEMTFKNSKGEVINKVVKTPEEWAAELGKQEYYVIREKGTERSFTSSLLKNKDSGVYTCGACDLPLFASDTKFKSGTGWPSFYQPIDKEVILEDTDYDLGYARTEVLCRRCEGHLGHVFKDGPKPTGLRYCINGVSLNFEKSK